MLATFLKGATAAETWLFEFQAYAEPVSGNNQTSLSQTMNFGAEAANRIVILLFSVGSTSSAGNIGSVTIGGFSAIRAGRAPDLNSSAQAEIWYATGVSGTSGTCTINWSGSTAFNNIKMYFQTVSLYGTLSSTGFSENATIGTDVSPTISGTLSINEKDFVVGIWRAAAVTSGSNTTWTGLTEQTDFVNSQNRAASTAYLVPDDALTLNWSVTSADTSVNFPRAVVARFRHQ